MVSLTLAAVAAALAASPDDDVEWNGVSHLGIQDRRPVCPINGESFQVLVRAYKNDLTAVNVVWGDGTNTGTEPATVIAQRDAFDIWAATVPATTSISLNYYFEIVDGADTDYFSPGGMNEAVPVGDFFNMDNVNFNHAPVGATRTSDGGCVFKVWAPTSATCDVRGDFNGWAETPMTKIGEYFVAYAPNVANRSEYKFYFDDAIWNTDARARAINVTDFDNSIVEDPFAYDWVVDDFQTPPFEEMVIYQLHVGTFAGLNDPVGPAPLPSRYRDVADRVDHLVELGVNVVQLNPITEFPFDFSAGYNPITQWAPEWIYGTPDDLRYMVDVLHQNGIAVTLDIVWNHFDGGSNYLWNYNGSQIYFDTPAVETPWGSQADFDNANVRSYFIESAMMWFEEYRLDGFRVDGTDFMNMGEHGASGWGLMRELNSIVNWRWPNKIIYAEQLPDDISVTKPLDVDFGAGFDAQYYDNFTDRLRDELFAAAFGSADMGVLASLVENSTAYLSGASVVNYLELHDEAWSLSGGQRIVRTIDGSAPHDDEFAKSRTKLAQGFVFLSPGIPAILQGTEWLESNDFGVFEPNRLDWSKKTTYSGIFEYYKKLIALRTQNPALRADAGQQLYHFNDGGDVIAWQRFWNDGSVIVAVANFSNNDYGDYRIGLPQGGEWGEVLNSQAPEYEGTGGTNPPSFFADETPYDGQGWSKSLVLPRTSMVVLQWNPPTPTCAFDRNDDGNVDVTDLLDFLAAWFAGNADFDNSGATDINDLLGYLAGWFAGC